MGGGGREEAPYHGGPQYHRMIDSCHNIPNPLGGTASAVSGSRRVADVETENDGVGGRGQGGLLLGSRSTSGEGSRSTEGGLLLGSGEGAFGGGKGDVMQDSRL